MKKLMSLFALGLVLSLVGIKSSHAGFFDVEQYAQKETEVVNISKLNVMAREFCGSQDSKAEESQAIPSTCMPIVDACVHQVTGDLVALVYGELCHASTDPNAPSTNKICLVTDVNNVFNGNTGYSSYDTGTGNMSGPKIATQVGICLAHPPLPNAAFRLP